MEANLPAKRTSRFFAFLESSIGKKIMVAAAGILLCGFLVTHLAGNMFIFVGAESFNYYAETLEKSPLLPIAEAGLLLLFLVHVVLSYRATQLNRAARPEGYELYRSKGARTWGSRSMAWTGTLILAFVIIHVATFKYKQLGGPKGADLYAHVLAWFRDPWYSGFYVLSVAGLALHLSHGIQSAAQTFGLSHPRYTPLIKKAGLAFALLMFVGFASMPVYFGYIHRSGPAPEGGSK